jgi:hypothetical protein
MLDKPSRTTPWRYYEFFVQQNYNEFLNEEGSITRAFNACVPAFQLADVFYKYYQHHDRTKISQWKTPKDLLIHLCALEPHFVTIQSVTFVYKHLYATKGHYDVGSPMSLNGILTKKIEIAADWSNESGVPPRVTVRKRDQTEAYIVDALRPVVEKMWPRFLPQESDEDW